MRGGVWCIADVGATLLRAMCDSLRWAMLNCSPLARADAARIAAAAPFAHVAVETAGAPHVSPVLFASYAGRVWFLIARGTLKARTLAVRPRAGVLLRDGERAVVLRGPVRLLDPARPDRWIRAPREASVAPLALQAFSLRNPRELAGFALDALGGAGATGPGEVVLASLEPAWSVVAKVPAKGRSRSPDGPAPLDGVPHAVADLAERDGPAALGWMTAAGPVALPAHWRAATGSAAVPTALLEAAGARGVARACVTLDAADGRRPTAKRGLMLRGRGRARRGSVVLDVERATWWIGFETGTVPVSGRRTAAAPARPAAPRAGAAGAGRRAR
jgi:hypothetical protein